MRSIYLAFSILVLGACANDRAIPELGPPRQGPIEFISICGEAAGPTSCGAECTRDSECGLGTFCLGGVCDAMCVADGDQCGAEASCTERGRCERDEQIGPGPSGCSDVVPLPTERVIPNITLVIDRSGSMEADFEGDCQFMTPPDTPCAASGTPNPAFGDQRWAAARDVLVGTGGLVERLGSIVRFGFAAYDKPPGDMCPPALAEVPVRLNNLGPIAALYNGIEPRGGWTPTAEAIDSVTASTLAEPPSDGPSVFLLATDGFPNGCDEMVGNQQDLANTEAAVARAYAAGISTYVLGVSFEDSHLQDLAVAGRGGEPDAQWWDARNIAELEEALYEIVDLNIPCEVELGGSIRTVRACEGNVSLNDESLECGNETRGWRALDGNSIELLGTACAQWRSGLVAELKAEFPCGVVVN